MRRTTLKKVVCIFFIQVSLIAILFTTYGYGATEEITPEFANAPVIDGILGNEWDNANLTNTALADLNIKLRVMQDSTNLFISIEFDLDPSYRNDTEFIGILISNSSSANPEDFVDAKVVRFSNLTDGNYAYLDCYIDNYNIKQNDTNLDFDGNGAAKMYDSDTIIYEFSIPIGNTNDNDDAFLDYSNKYAFNITYGDWNVYPGGITKSHCVLITIQDQLPIDIDFTELVLFILSIVAYSFIGAFISLYKYKIIIFKKKIGRLIG